MPHRRTCFRTRLARLAFVAVLGWAVFFLRSGGRREATETPDDVTTEPKAQPALAKFPVAAVATLARTSGRRRGFASGFTLVALFFAGAALSAGAGDGIVQGIESGSKTAAIPTEVHPGEGSNAIPPEEASGEGEGEAGPREAPAGEPQPPAETPPASEAPPAAAAPAPGEGESAPEGPGVVTPVAAPAQPSSRGRDEPVENGRSAAKGGDATPATSGDQNAPAPVESSPPLLVPHPHEQDEATHELDIEANTAGSYATVWLHPALPDPTPRAKRLAPAFARLLRTEAGRAGVGWAVLLGALRADGKGGRIPARRLQLRALAAELRAQRRADEWRAFLALRGRTTYADRALALTRYNRAVGLGALVLGLDASKAQLARRVLTDSRLHVYAGGRADVKAGRIDVRVLVLLRYLAEAHGQVTVSSLRSGHRLYARPGVVSAHVYGLAADIAALGGTAIMGNSQPGGTTEQAIHNILQLPAELRPQQVISLLDLGGPSFPLANHADHIHVGY